MARFHESCGFGTALRFLGGLSAAVAAAAAASWFHRKTEEFGQGSMARALFSSFSDETVKHQNLNRQETEPRFRNLGIHERNELEAAIYASREKLEREDLRFGKSPKSLKRLDLFVHCLTFGWTRVRW